MPAKEAPQMADPVGTGFYVEIFGGARLAGQIDYINKSDGSSDGVEPLNLGPAYGGAIGYFTGIGGLSLELDALRTSTQFTLDANTSVDTLSLMANAKYSIAVTDAISLYGAVGVGAIHGGEVWHSQSFVDATQAGYQLIAGVSANVTPNVGVLVEYRYQNTFVPFPPVSAPDNQNIPSSVVLAGLKLSTN